MTTGVMKPGSAADARTAALTGPSWNHRSSPVMSSVATAVNGTGRSSIRASPRISLTRAKIFSARMAPGARGDTS
jgi:hypothetical protein